MAYEFIAVGTSWGGLRALEILLGALPVDFPIPIGVVQHRRADSDDTLAQILSRTLKLKVREVDDKEAVAQGMVHVAPADYHMLVETPKAVRASKSFALTTEEPVGHSRPSIDVFFESCAEVFQANVIGVILTGANRDGTRGLSKIRQAGGMTIAQDPEEAECPIMPRSAIDAKVIDRVLSLEAMSKFLTYIARRPQTPHPAGVRA